MNAIKRLHILSFFLIAACAPKPPTIEVPLHNDNMQISSKTSTKISKNSPDKRYKISSSKTELNTASIKTKTGTIRQVDEEAIEDKPSSSSKDLKLTRAAASSASRISSWEISGAIAARNRNKGWNASLNWLQRGQNQYQIRLSGPLGSGTIIVNRRGSVVTLRDGPKTVSSSNASSLLRQQTGISLPVNNLYYWVRGIPAPGGVQSAKHDSAGRLMFFRQGGYTISYQQYTSAGKAILPSNIRLQGNGIFIKLVIRQWKV